MAIGMAIFSVAMGAMQYSNAQSAAKRQERIAEEGARAQEEITRLNISNMEQETEESARRMAKEHEKEEGSARARAAASGFSISGSASDYLEEQSAENRRQITWLKESSASRADIAKREGYLQADMTRTSGELQSSNTRTQGTMALISSVGSAYNYGSGKIW